MSWTYAYTPHIWPSFFTILLLIVLSAYSWRKRSVPGALPFAIYCLLGLPMLAFKMMGYLAVDFETKIFWFKVENAWWLPIVTAMTCFVLEYAIPGRWLTRRNLALLSIVPLLALVSLVTNDFHHLSFRGYGFNGSIVPLYGPVGWIFMVYVLGLTILNMIVFAWLFIRSRQHRWPVVILLTAQLIVRALALLDPYLQDSWFFYMPEITFTVLACAIALFGFRIFDPILLARQTAITQMQIGMLVLDLRGRVADLNPAAELVLGIAAKQARGHPLSDLLPAAPPLTGEAQEGKIAQAEIQFGKGPETRYFEWETSSLKDWRGLLAGHLCLLHDVTEQKRAQVQEMERLWAHATLQEREQLAGELHDGLSQSLGFLNLQAQTAQVYLQAGQNEAARDSLARLTEAAGQIQEDTRELIGNLLVVIRPAENFCATLRQVLAAFEQQTSLAVHLDIDTGAPPMPAGDGGSEACFDPSRLPPLVAVQLVRITQEALANMRRHARGASQAHVELVARDGHVFLTIADDGAGFDPVAPPIEGKHFGLQVMHQRAARVGGQVEVWSAPGKGTRITVCVPMAPQAAGD